MRKESGMNAHIEHPSFCMPVSALIEYTFSFSFSSYHIHMYSHSRMVYLCECMRRHNPNTALSPFPTHRHTLELSTWPSFRFNASCSSDFRVPLLHPFFFFFFFFLKDKDFRPLSCSLFCIKEGRARSSPPFFFFFFFFPFPLFLFDINDVHSRFQHLHYTLTRSDIISPNGPH